jgi:hypothetical protein
MKAISDIEWFAMLAKADLEALEPGDHLKFLVDTMNMVAFGTRSPGGSTLKGHFLSYFGMDFENEFRRWIDLGILKRCRDKIHNILSEIVEIVEKARSSLAVSTSEEVCKYGGPVAHVAHVGIEQFHLKLEGGSFVLVAEGAPEDVLAFRFIVALQGVPLDSLRRCQQCGSVFINLTKYHKVYCTRKCTLRGAKKKHRAKVREGVEKYGVEA